ncbi:hypothetical protein SKAU_G00109510 [Synaphobranchus kaupii]|uniref:PH domain-containing protein n=1 Tax=Synaphobranchus kaupii TaxID=118154 RepID=A0A9Q1J895_SYNKA|nr:hypothetical protein SKAU_G00109510 [Synaphobranchus kaupii]
MLKFRADRRVSQNDHNGTTGHPVIRNHLVEIKRTQTHSQSSSPDMSTKATGKRFVSFASDVNSNNLTMVSDLSPETQVSSQTPRTTRKAATFGKRSNSMRRNPTADVTKQGWLYKQASNGVKQWNKRWFVLTDRCLFYYKDEKEETVLGSLPLLGFQIGAVQPSDGISRKYAFKVFSEVEEEEEDSNGSSAFCLQVEHAGIRTYYFSSEGPEEQEAWLKVMSEAARMSITPAQRNNMENIPPAGLNNATATRRAEPHQRGEGDGRGTDLREGKRGVGRAEQEPPASDMDGRGGERGRDRGGAPQPNGWGGYGAYQPQDSRDPWEARAQRENAYLHRGFDPAPRPASDRLTQRQNSMTQLQQWVNQRRGAAAQDDLPSPSHYYAVNRGVPPDCYGGYGGPRFVEEYAVYPPGGMRPDSICSVSGGFDRVPPPWSTPEEKRRSLRDGPLYPRVSQWGTPPHPQHCGGVLRPAGTGAKGHAAVNHAAPLPLCTPISLLLVPPKDTTPPIRSPSARFERDRDDIIYTDPSVYGLRRSVSSPKYDFHRDSHSMTAGLYHYNYPGSLHDNMEDMTQLQLQRNLDYLEQQQVAPFHEVYTDLPPALGEIDIDNLLGRLCEQNRLLKEEEVLVQRLRLEKDNLEGGLVATHQELEVYCGQPALADKLHLKKETLQNQLINIRGELSQASSALTTTRMEFEVLEDEVNAVHGDLWEQLNAGGQNEVVHRHFQKEFWKIQDVLEGLHKNNPSRGTDTATHRVASLASGSFSTNSPASPLSSASLTSPLSPFSPVSGSHDSPPKQVGVEYKYTVHSDTSSGGRTNSSDQQKPEDDRQTSTNKVGIVPPRTKSPTEEETRSVHPAQQGDGTLARSIHPAQQGDGTLANGHISRGRPKSAVFPAEVKSKMSVEEQNARLRRNQSSSVRDKRRSGNTSGSQQGDAFRPSYRVVRRRLTSHEVDIKDLEEAVRGQGVESPREEIARLRRLQIEPEHSNSKKELPSPDKVLIQERYVEEEPDIPLSPEEVLEKQKKVERIKTLIAKSNLQNMVPVLDGPAERQGDPDQQLQEQEKRIEMSCALAAEASRRSRLLSAQSAPSPPTAVTDLTPPPFRRTL